ETLDALLTDPDALRSKLRVYARAAVSFTAPLVDRHDLSCQSRIRANERRSGPFAPCMKPAARDTENVAERRDGVGLLGEDERELHVFSIAKKAAAFFNISRSICSRL